MPILQFLFYFYCLLLCLSLSHALGIYTHHWQETRNRYTQMKEDGIMKSEEDRYIHSFTWKLMTISFCLIDAATWAYRLQFRRTCFNITYLSFHIFSYILCAIHAHHAHIYEYCCGSPQHQQTMLWYTTCLSLLLSL